MEGAGAADDAAGARVGDGVGGPERRCRGLPRLTARGLARRSPSRSARKSAGRGAKRAGLGQEPPRAGAAARRGSAGANGTDLGGATGSMWRRKRPS